MTEQTAGAQRSDDIAREKAEVRRRVRSARAARRRDRAPGSREEEAAALAAAILAHFDACPEAAAAGWGTPRATVAAFRSTPSEPDTSALLDALLDRGVRVLVPRTRDDLTLDWHQLLPRGARRSGDGGAEDSAVSTPDAPTHPGPRAASTHDAPPEAAGSGAIAFGAACGSGASGATIAATTSGAAGASGTTEAPATDGRAELPGTDDTGDEGPALGLDAIADVTAMILPGIAVDRCGHRLGQGGGCYDRTLPRLRPGTCHAVLLFDDEVVDGVPFGEFDRRVPAVVTPGGGWRRLGDA